MKIPHVSLESLYVQLDSAVKDGMPAKDALAAKAVLAVIEPDLNAIVDSMNAAIGVQAAHVMGAMTDEEAAEKLAVREKEAHALVVKLFDAHLAGVLNVIFGLAHNSVFKLGFGKEMEAKDAEQQTVEAK